MKIPFSSSHLVSRRRFWLGTGVATPVFGLLLAGSTAAEPAASPTTAMRPVPLLAHYAPGGHGGSSGSGKDNDPLPPLPDAQLLPPERYPSDVNPLPDPREAMDEAMSGRTRLGTPVARRTPEHFPAEERDLFWQMDQVASGLNGELQPLDFDINRDGKISDLRPEIPRSSKLSSERDAIRGRNTWLLWGGGNEVFWNWLQQEGYGTHDFLIMLDSRQRGNRFSDMGMINQPGMAANSQAAGKILGLYLDRPASPLKGPDGSIINDNPILLRPRQPKPGAEGTGAHYPGAPGRAHPPAGGAAYYLDLVETHDAQGRKLEVPVSRPAPREGQPSRLFEPGDEGLVDRIRKALAHDGVDPDIYGYPSGVIGLRLFLNPDFFGTGDAPAAARAYWDRRVVNNHDRYYTDPTVYSDRRLVRPFRVGMSCAFCHVSMHPLCPPLDPEAPEWENLSNSIGNQYWRPQKAFGYLLPRDTFVHHFLGSQQPGTIDTSQVATDQINNSNTINAVFDVPARLDWAEMLPEETQSQANQRLIRSYPWLDAHSDKRRVPRVLVDGSDSIGAFGALARVYLNIGTYYEQWERTNNIFIGFTDQRPFSVETCQRNSVYWQTNERYRAGYLREFFTLKQREAKNGSPANSATAGASDGTADQGSPPGSFAAEATPPAVVSVWAGTDTLEVYDPDHRAQNATEPMKLRNAVEVKRNPDGTAMTPTVYERVGPNFLPEDEAHVRSRKNGRYVWLNNCAICHSSKQPAKFGLRFSRDWQKAPVPGPGSDPVYTLPMDFKDWEDFRKSPAMNDYRERLFARVRKEARDENPVDAAAVSKALEEGNFLRAAELRGGALLMKQDPAKEDHPFWKDNFLSTDIRVPVTLVGTNAARALGTNAVSGHMWADFSSDTYKGLDSVGKIPYYDPFSDKEPDAFWNNAEFDAPGGGVGYYRPATHISLWATAPFLHNNTLGLFNNDPSVQGRVAAFEDAMNKMLTRSERGKHSIPGATDVPMGAIRTGDLRPEGPHQKDPGFIYRTPRETRLQIGSSFVRPLVAGLAGKGVTNVLSLWLWVVLVPVFVLLAWKARARHAGFVLLTLAALLAGLLLFTGIGGFGAGGVFSVIPVILMALSNVLAFSHKAWWLLVIAIALLGWGLLHAKPVPRTFKRWGILVAVASVALLLCLAVGIFKAGEVAGYLVRLVAYLQEAGVALRIVAGLVAAVAFLIAWVRYGGEGISRLIYTAFAIASLLVGFVAHQFIEGKLVVHGESVGVDVGPLPRGMPVNFLMNMDPRSPHGPQAIVSMFYGMTEIKRRHLEGDAAWEVFAKEAGPALIKASKCPDYVLDRGHWFGEDIDAAHKADLIEFLKTL